MNKLEAKSSLTKQEVAIILIMTVYVVKVMGNILIVIFLISRGSTIQK